MCPNHNITIPQTASGDDIPCEISPLFLMLGNQQVATPNHIRTHALERHVLKLNNSLHANGQQLAYIHIDPETEQRSLRTLNTINKVETELVPSDTYSDFDIPLLYEDTLYFVVLKEAPKGNLRGNGVVNAHGNHNQPADWYMLSSNTSMPQQISDEELVLLFGAISPDGNYLASVTSLGVYITDFANGETWQVLKSRAIRSLVWVE